MCIARKIHNFKIREHAERVQEKRFLETTIDKVATQKIKLSIKDFFSKCDQIRRKLRIWSHLLKKSLKENSIF